MEDLIGAIGNHATAAILAVACALLILFLILKKLFKLFLLLILILLIICGYYYYKDPREFSHRVTTAIEETRSKTGEIVEKGKKIYTTVHRMMGEREKTTPKE